MATHAQEAKAAQRIGGQDTEAQRCKDSADKHDEIDDVLHGGVRLLLRQATQAITHSPGDCRLRGNDGSDPRSNRMRIKLDVRKFRSRVLRRKHEIRTRPF